MTRLLARWLADDAGQDLIEYVLLAGAVGFAAVAGVTYLTGAMGFAYSALDSAGQSDALVEVPDPQ